MAILRSLGANLFTFLCPIVISPLEISSKPATERNKVDFPHPEGPIITINSPFSFLY